MSNLLSARALFERLDDPDLRLIDTRFSLQDPQAGRRAYEAGHLPGALYLDLDRDLSSPVRADRRGGRHPLPDMDAFARRLGGLGIGSEHQVVVYDDSGGMFAGRLWWLLRYAGHARVQVLDGGLSAWLEAGYPTTTDAPTYPATSFELHLQPGMVVDRQQVLRNLDNPNVLLLDARSAERYRGENETLDPQGGHIPGALSRPFADNLERGRYKSAEALKARFEDLSEAEEVIVYCGSGVSAAHDLIALEEAGIKNAKLYAGSWSDWLSHEDAPVATGEEP